MQRFPIIMSLLVAAFLTAAQVYLESYTRIWAVLAGFLAGFALYHAAFGFAGGWRRFVTEGSGRGIRAQMLLIALVVPVSFTLIAAGKTGGWVVPVGPGFLFGAAVFGIGMSLAGSCASGTLFVAGGGSTRMMIALAAFITGSVLGTAHVPFWLGLGQGTQVSFVRNFGVGGAIAITYAICGALVLLTLWLERKWNVQSAPAPRLSDTRLLRGPWHPWVGSVALAIVCIMIFVTLRRPWGVTEAFALWGAKVGVAAGLPIDQWTYWSGGRSRQLEATVLSHTTSILNFSLIAGAFCASAIQGRFKPVLNLSTKDVVTAVIGGLLMGYGARLSSGCNIGAFLGGVTSGSLHGWIWALTAFLGFAAALRLPPMVMMRRLQNAPS